MAWSRRMAADEKTMFEIYRETDYNRAFHSIFYTELEEHARETGSHFAATMLSNWDQEWPRFWQVCPKEMLTRLAHPIEAAAAIAAE